jgi:hypothetical protein
VPAEGTELHRFRLQRSAAPCISSPMLPSLTARLPDSTGIVILAMTRMTAPPLDAAAPVRAPPVPGPLERPALTSIARTLPGGACLTPGPTVWIGP